LELHVAIPLTQEIGKKYIRQTHGRAYKISHYTEKQIKEKNESAATSPSAVYNTWKQESLIEQWKKESQAPKIMNTEQGP
jgi:hypothetical protein